MKQPKQQFWDQILAMLKRMNGTEWWLQFTEALSQSTRSPAHTSVCFMSRNRPTGQSVSVTCHRRCSGGSDTLPAEGPTDHTRWRKTDPEFALNTDDWSQSLPHSFKWHKNKFIFYAVTVKLFLVILYFTTQWRLKQDIKDTIQM